MTLTSSQTVYSTWSTQNLYQQVSPYNTKWGAGDAHLTAGPNSNSSIWYVAFQRFSGWNFSGISRITSAVMYVRLTAGNHTARVGTYPVMHLWLPTTDYPTNGGSVETTMTINNTGYSLAYQNAQALGGNGQGTTQSLDVRCYLYRIAPSSVWVDGYGAGQGQTDWGIAVDGANANNVTEWWSAQDSRKPYITFNYEIANRAPNTPAISGFTNAGQYPLENRYTAVSQAGDVDGDATAGCIEWGAASGYGVQPGGWTAAPEGWSYTIPSGSMSRGQWYGVRGRLRDEHNAYGSYSGTQWFYVNRLPNAPVIS